MYITGYRFRKSLLGNIVLQVKVGGEFADATRSDYMYLLDNKNEWRNPVIEMADTSNEFATGVLALRYSSISRKVLLMVEEYDCLLTQYRKDFVNAKEKHVKPLYLV